MNAYVSLLPSLCCMLVAILSFSASAQHFYENVDRYSKDRIPACRRRGGGAYCSAGQTQSSYVGPLDTAQQLRDALKATAFKNEIIIFAETRIADAAQAIARIRGSAGYGHLLPVMADPSQCHRLARIFSAFTHEQGPISCGTYATADESGHAYPTGFRYLRTGFGMTAWWRKWFTVARSVMLGLNVMAIDADVLVLDDWYWRVKQPPLAQYNMLSQAECGICINGGFSYIQNASSQGPVAWLLYEAMHRAVRWAEDDSALRAMSARVAGDPILGRCPDDQTLLTDTLWNAVRGEIRFASIRCMLEGDTEALGKLGFDNIGSFITAQEPRIPGFEVAEYQLSGELDKVACESFREPFECRRFGATVGIKTAKLHVPHSGGVWPREYGGYPFHPNGGSYTEAYRKAFQELGVQLPPSPEDPDTEARAKNITSETFGFLHVEDGGRASGRWFGSWAESNWFTTGRVGLWHTHLDPPRVQSIGHIHAGLYPGNFQKTVVLQTSGHFDWRVAARVGGGPSRLFFANYPSRDALDQGVQEQMVEVQRVVAYAPGVISSKLAKVEFIRAVEGLAQVATALGAVVAWPAAPCDAEWVLTPAGAAAGRPPPPAQSLPWYHINTQYVVMPFGESREQLQCEWVGFAVADCLMNQGAAGGGLHSGRGLLAVEFEHLRRHTTPHYTVVREPNPDSTLRLTEDTQPPAAHSWTEPHYEQLLRLNTELLLLQPPHQQHQHPVAIFWVDRLVGAVHGMTGAAERVWGTWRQRCRALKYYELDKWERADW